MLSIVNTSIARRLAVMFALVAASVFAGLGAGLFPILRSQLDAHLRDALDDRMQIAKIIVSHAATPEKWHVVQEKLSDMSPEDGAVRYAVSSADPAFRFGAPLTGSIAQSWRGGYDRLRPAPGVHDTSADMLTSTLRIPASGARPMVVLQGAFSYRANMITLHAIYVAFWALSAAASLAVLILSYAVTRFGLLPLKRLGKEASAVSPDNRSQRLNTGALPDELNDLAHAFNGALERLDGAYGRLESFNADVAHELRTPVTILIGQTEVALTSDRSVIELRGTLQSNLEEFERMRGIINDMLFLARADQGERATGLVEVCLAQELAHTLDFLDMAFEDAGVKAVVHGDATAMVNRSLFGRACTNLLLNAIQHCAPGDIVTVQICREGSAVRIAVTNPGAPIAAQALDHLFDRFYRVEASRPNSRENHGLGLAIVKAVAEMHDGAVSCDRLHGGNVFSFSIDASRGLRKRCAASA